MKFEIAERRETPAHKKTSHTARARKRAAAREKPLEFIAVDGEGVTGEDGIHRYVLLSVGTKHITNPAGLATDEIFGFLWDCYLEHGSTGIVYCGFFLGYDFTQWLKGLPEDRARMLLTEEGRAARTPKSGDRVQPFPVRWEGWEFDILGMKRFRLRHRSSSRWMTICDTGPFFQKSFLKVIDPREWKEPVVTPAEYQTILNGKTRRATAVLDSDMLSYNALENEILPRVLQRLDAGFRDLGIALRPGQWYGPGQAASAWLKGRAITREEFTQVTPRPVIDAARASYYGGWFEITAHGMVANAVTYEYDINSAYPYIISRLPCLAHGEWRQGDYANTDRALRLVYASVEGDDHYLGAMLHRDAGGNIYRPHRTEGWYWQHELTAALQAGLVARAHASDVWDYHGCDCLPPFREVADIYDLRKRAGRKTPLGIACKLVPNSLYGKFAQSVGAPEFANPVYASLVTAGCRTLATRAIGTHPGGTRACLMIATDGVYFTSPHPGLEVNGELGGWDSARRKHMTLFKPGVYWDEDARAVAATGGAPVFKSRGISAAAMAGKLEEADWKFGCMGKDVFKPGAPSRPVMWPWVKFPVPFAMTTGLQAIRRGDWGKAGEVIQEIQVVQSADPASKRCDPREEPLSPRSKYRMWRTSPRVNDPYEPSHPYEKKFGIDDPFSEEHVMMSPDGPIAATLLEGLGIK